MRRILVGALLFSAFAPMGAMAQTAPALTCEERAAILTQLVEDLSIARRTVEIEHAVLKAKRVVVPPQKDTTHGADTSTTPNQNP